MVMGGRALEAERLSLYAFPAATANPADASVSPAG
jgi:hypothetical protein